MNSKAPSLCRSPIPAKQLLNGQHSGRCCGLCSQRVPKELNHCASPLRRIDHYVSRFSCASCSNLVGLARFFSRYCGGVLGLFHVVFSIILAERFFGQSSESICFFERSFCGLADLLLRQVFRRHLKLIALRFHGHGFVSGLFGCCRVSSASVVTHGSIARTPQFTNLILASGDDHGGVGDHASVFPHISIYRSEVVVDATAIPLALLGRKWVARIESLQE
jgi:hypothetical protein